jgi:hypothetical protein
VADADRDIKPQAIGSSEAALQVPSLLFRCEAMARVRSKNAVQPVLRPVDRFHHIVTDAPEHVQRVVLRLDRQGNAEKQKDPDPHGSRILC